MIIIWILQCELAIIVALEQLITLKILSDTLERNGDDVFMLKFINDSHMRVHGSLRSMYFLNLIRLMR